MPAAIPIAIAVTAAATTYGAIQQNQQLQHAKGAAQAQQTAMNDQLNKQTQMDQANKTAKNTNANATQQAAIAALKASMSANSAFGGSLLTGTSGTPAANPAGAKTLLGA